MVIMQHTLIPAALHVAAGVVIFVSQAFGSDMPYAPIPDSYVPAFLRQALPLYNAGKTTALLSRLEELSHTKAGRKLPDKILLLQGLTYESLGRTEDAAQALIGSLRARRSNSDALYELARCRLAAGQNEAGLKLLQEALWFNRFGLVAAEKVQCEVGQYYERAQKPELAQAAYRAALALNPKYLPAKTQLAQLLFSDGDQDAAIGMLRQANNKNPDNEDVKRQLASALLSNAKRAVNKRDLTQALELTSSVAKTKSTAALYRDPIFPVHLRALCANGKVPEAQALLSQAAAALPGDAGVALLQRQLNLEQQATSYQAALSSAEGSSSAKSE